MWWGVGAALVANALYSVGFVVEKRALGSLPALSADRPLRVIRVLATSPLWIVGALALAAGFGAQLVVYRALPIAAAQGIFVSGLVLLLLLSSAVLGEEATGRERYALGGVLLALLMVVGSVREGEDVVSGGAPWKLVLLVCVPALAVGCLAVRTGGEPRDEAAPGPDQRYRLRGGGGAAVRGQLAGDQGHQPGLTGAGPAETALSLLGSPYPYLLLFTSVAGLVMSQAALQRCRASLVVPVCTTVTCVFTAVLGTLAFGESLPDDPLLVALRVGGTALALSVLLAMPRHDPRPAAAPDHRPGPYPTDAPPSTPPDTEEPAMTPDDPLLALLACPLDKGPLSLLPEDEGGALYNPRLRLRYPVVDGVPQLLPSSGRKVSADDHERLLARIEVAAG